MAADRSTNSLVIRRHPFGLPSADYEAYLAQYPEGNFAALARACLAELIESAGAVRTPAEREIELAEAAGEPVAEPVTAPRPAVH